jgi:hypothetical protein
VLEDDEAVRGAEAFVQVEDEFARFGFESARATRGLRLAVQPSTPSSQPETAINHDGDALPSYSRADEGWTASLSLSTRDGGWWLPSWVPSSKAAAIWVLTVVKLGQPVHMSRRDEALTVRTLFLHSVPLSELTDPASCIPARHVDRLPEHARRRERDKRRLRVG